MSHSRKGIRKKSVYWHREKTRKLSQCEWRGKDSLEKIKPQACLWVLDSKHVFNLLRKQANIYMAQETPHREINIAVCPEVDILRTLKSQITPQSCTNNRLTVFSQKIEPIKDELMIFRKHLKNTVK